MTRKYTKSKFSKIESAMSKIFGYPTHFLAPRTRCSAIW